MRRRLGVTLPLLLLVIMLAGCASGRPPASTATPPPAQTPSAVPAATPGKVTGPVTLTYWEEDLDAAGIVLDELAAEFMAANPNVTVKRTHQTYEDLRTQFREISRGNLKGELPHLVRGPGEYAGPFSELGLLRPVDDIFSPDFLGQYFSGALDGASVRGRVWGAPDNFGDTLLLFYNRGLVQDPPRDTDAWIAQLKTLTNGEEGRYGLVFAANESYWLIPWLAGFGGWPLDPQEQPVLDTAEMIEALWFIHDLMYAHRVTPAPVNYTEAFRLFGEGKAAYIIDGRWNLERYRELGIDLGVALLPRVTKTGLVPAPMAAGRYWYIPRGLEGEQLDVALRFVEFMTSAPAQAAWVTRMGRLPSHRDTASALVVTEDPNIAPLVAQLRVARGVPPALEMACAWRGLDSQLGEVVSGNLSPDKAAPAMQVVADDCMAEIALDPTPTPAPTP